MDTVAPEKVGLSAARLKRLNMVMTGHADGKTTHGIITMIARRGKLAHLACYGMMDAEAAKPMPPDAIFRIFSMSKPITCAALMMLFEEGAFQLADPVHAFIPAFRKTKVFVRETAQGLELAELERPITMRDLLMHTAGLSYGMHQDTPVDALYRQAGPSSRRKRQRVSLTEMVDLLAGLPLVFQPGASWRYSLAHDVVGYLVQLLSGMPFDRFLQERIFQPLGMVDTGFVAPPDKLARLTALYTAVPEGGLRLEDAPSASEWADPLRTPSGGGGLVSTAGDYLRFAQMLLNGGSLDGVRLLSRKTVELMTRNHLPANLLPFSVDPGRPRHGYGYGLGVGVLLNGAEAGELMSDGSYQWNGAASTRWWNDPKEQLIGIMMTQLMRGELRPPVGQVFRNLVYQAIDD